MAIDARDLYDRISIPKNNPYNIKITNIVFGVELGSQVPLDRIANYLENAEYEPESFPGLVYRIPDYGSTALVFTSGMCILSGINNIDLAIKSAEKMVEDFKSIGINFDKDPKLTIVNLVVSAELHALLDLNKIVYELGDCEYEPEQFPGLIYRMDNPKVVVLIFNTGRVVITGSKDVKISAKAAEVLRKRLKEVGAIIKDLKE